MTDQNKAVLRLPLIGRFEKIDVLDAVGKIVELTGNDNEKNEVLQNLERALGDYLMDSGGYQKILDLLFLGPETIDVEEVFNWSKNDFPLFSWVFAETSSESDSSGNQKREKGLSSAWSALMLELGEFKLDERFNEIKNEIENLMPYLCKDRKNPEQHSVLYALFEDNTKIMNEIWKRIVGEDICLIFVDDEPEFDEKWGFKEILDEKVDIDESKRAVIAYKKSKLKKCDMRWINPVGDIEGEIKGYDNKSTKNKILSILDSTILKKDQDEIGLLPVLVIDLLYKDNKGINKIEGDNLIRELREERKIKTPLIIGFTAGKSPFVINSAVKAGADIVIQKERGETIKLSDIEHGSGNPGGLFDLLWALSKNISRWCFLEKCKAYIHKQFSKGKGFYRPVLEPLFFSIENESPFWKEYLTNWLREVEDIRLKAIFENELKKKENEHD